MREPLLPHVAALGLEGNCALACRQCVAAKDGGTVGAFLSARSARGEAVVPALCALRAARGRLLPGVLCNLRAHGWGAVCDEP